MTTEDTDLFAKVKRSLADLADLYSMLGGEAFDVVNEVRMGLSSRELLSVTGLAVSRVSDHLSFSLPNDIGPELVTLSLHPDNTFSVEIHEDVEWVAMHVFLDVDLANCHRLYIDSRYAAPNWNIEGSFPIEYFFRVYAPAEQQFRDSYIKRDEIFFGEDAKHVHKLEFDPQSPSLGGRRCMVFFFPDPPREILITKLRIYCI